MTERQQAQRKARAVRKPAKPAVAVKQQIAELKRELAQALERQAATSEENTRLLAELREALDQQTATADVLKLISRSTLDLQPVLDTLAETATRLCNAEQGTIWRQDGDVLSMIGSYGHSEEADRFIRESHPGPGRGTLVGRTVLEGRAVHILDARQDPEYTWSEAVERVGFRTMLGVPLLRDGMPIGAFSLYRTEVRPFTEKQIDLVATFADQAVIAVENVRLITETREALERQTATAEVLQVINSSPGNLAPVFDAILEKAHGLCGVAYGSLQLYDGEKFRAVAVHGLSQAFADRLRQGYRPGPNSPNRLLREGGRFVHIPDLGEIDNPTARAAFELSGIRTTLFIPLRKDGALLGQIVAQRREVKLFTEKEIALLESFAAQAVIAMENARLMTETREALEQQTATAEVLQVINSSPGNLAPVFEAMLDKALGLCGAAFGALWTYDGERMHATALRGPPAFAEFLRRGPHPVGPDNAHGRHLRGEPVVHIADIIEDKAYQTGDPIRRSLVELGGGRTMLSVPLRKDERFLGDIIIYRREVKPYSDRQIALLQNFAAHAVIAMENARLITETREALEQQTATAEVLRVINSSPGDLAPVFDAILEKAMRLCDAAFGVLWSYEGENFRASAFHGVPPAFADFATRGPHPPGLGTARGTLLRGGAVVHITDAVDTEAYRSGEPLRRAVVDLGGARTLLGVPLRKDDALLGVFVIYRQEVRPFSDKQIALLQNFAAQAVIAMENARLITETREALEQQTATAEVLRVINRSPGELAPVFDAILEKAHNLCSVSHGALHLYDGGKFHAVAVRGLSGPLADRLRQRFSPGPNQPSRRLLDGERFAHVPDLGEIDDPISRAAYELNGNRTALFIPLRKEETLLGMIVAARREVRPFSDKEIALLESFAAQAVIAMDNARLLDEIRTRNDELAEALEFQTATGEVLRIVASSPDNLQSVFEAMLEKATQLCEAKFGNLLLYDGEVFTVAADRNLPPAYAQAVRAGPVRPGPNTALARLLQTKAPAHIPDMRNDIAYAEREPLRTATVELGGVRSMVAIPLLKKGEIVGAFTIYRHEAGGFRRQPDRAGAPTSPTQAVIAMDNARLFDELRQRQAELRVTFDNMGDGVAMFDGQTRASPRGTATSSRSSTLPDALLAQRLTYADYLRIPRRTRRVRHRRHRGGIEPTPPGHRARIAARAHPPGRSGDRGAPEPSAGRRLRADLCRHHRAEAGRGSDQQARDAAESGAARAADGTGEPAAYAEDGGARPAHCRHRPRDQEPTQFRQ